MNSKTLVQNILIAIPIMLMGLGTLMIYSSSSIFAAQKYSDNAFFLKKQIVFAVCGIISMFAVKKIRYTYYKKLAYPLWVFSMVLLVLVLMPGIGTKVGGAVRWLRFGPLSFQPAELGKLAAIIILSFSLAKKDAEKIQTFSIGVLPHLIFIVPMCTLIVLQPDFGTAMILFVFLLIMLFIGGIQAWQLLMLGAVCTGTGAALIFSSGYRIERLLSFLNPWKDATGAGFQIVQSFLAFGYGGFWGMGLGNGTQKLFYLPEPHTDFILAVIGEEFGFVGVICVVILFLMFVICGLKIAINASDAFGSYMAMGIVTLIGLQSIINMGVVMGLLPTKGIPLPFVSYGGTSLMINLIAVGILLSICSQSNFKINK